MNIRKSDRLLQYLIVCKSEVYNDELEYFLQKNPEKRDRYLSWVLEGYVKSKFVSVRTIALLNPAIAVDILRDRYNSSLWLERYAVAKNISTPHDIVQNLTQDANQIVRAAAKDNLNIR